MPNQNQWSVFKRLLTYLKPYKFLTFLALTFLLSTTVIKSIIPLVASYFIDHYLHDMNQAASMILIGYYGLYLLQTLVQYLGNLFFARVSYSIVRDIRRDAFANMEKLGMSYFDKTPAGSIVSRLTNDTETISEMFSGILSSFISAIFIFVTTLYTMMILDIRLTGLIVLFLPLIVLLVNLYRKKSVAIIEKTRALLSDINAKLSESIEGIHIIQAFNQEKRLKKEFDAINEEHLIYASRSISLDSLFLRPAMSLLKLLAYAVLMAYFGYRGIYLGITAGTMYAFIQYINRLFDPLIEVTQNFSTLQTSMVSAGRVFALIDERTYEPEQRDTAAKVTEGNIRFENVSFSYDGKHQILDNISFSVNKGETIAFVGSTGAGKTTMVNLLMRFYEINSGKIQIDGMDIGNLTRDNIHNLFGMVLQDTWLFEGTIRENICYGEKNISDERLDEICEAVGLLEMIHQEPEGYDTVLDDKASLSIGQKQLITIARAMVEDAPLMILDEATSSVDTRTELKVQKAMDLLTEGRTSFVIAHRLSTIRNADLILVMKDGDVIESGNHEELLKRQGFYAALYNSQFEEASTNM